MTANVDWCNQDTSECLVKLASEFELWERQVYKSLLELKVAVPCLETSCGFLTGATPTVMKR
jgi:hypothetical protein